ncbi:MAG: permease prefix domain 1-containing protein, partial [Gemmatimonadota bacterium]|nr:permease prefix domain 1-containing protein [Gemmatimonadota bacterium]
MDLLPGSRVRRSAQLREEIRFYLEERVRELVTEGLSEEEAWAEARAAFGDVDEVEAQVHAVHDRGRNLGMMRERLISAWR